MRNKKNVLMICSWLDYKLRLGSFFMDQASLLSENFNFVLVNFRPVKFKFKNLKKIYKTEKIVTEDKITILYIYYPAFKLIKGGFFLKLIEKKAFSILNKILKKENIEIDLIHAQGVFDAAFWALSYHEKYGTPYIFTEHNQFKLRNVNRKKIRRLDLILKKSRFNLVVSNDLIRQFATNGFFYDFVNIGNLVDERLFNYKRNKQGEYFEIMTVGAYDPLKDQITALKALKIIDNLNIEKIKFTWIGINAWGIGVDFEQEVNRLISSLEFKNIKIEIIKIASKAEIVSALQKSDVFIFTSICETFGISPLEALFVGVPVITTQSGGVNEFMNSKNGIVVPVKDFEALSGGVLSVMNKELQFDRELISKESIAKFGSEVFIEKMTSIYNDAFVE
ncbi:glycosyltransferase family 4 protein [Flavobacterium sp. LS1R49]|uniref:Glycosyltransferase family 4 protein n=1 Tax=Flavobacterium shii TaxID=2987687 RepID=A0A9X2ZDN5_9FLAO|nr:glycosyltransferase family 4 protein [Flavobacterium shii]MCV9926871.1 glycosyltransferase family 4 protein [Flavobacterium shii]